MTMTSREVAATLTSVERSTLIDYRDANYKSRLCLVRRLERDGIDVGALQDYLEAEYRALGAARP